MTTDSNEPKPYRIGNEKLIRVTLEAATKINELKLREDRRVFAYSNHRWGLQWIVLQDEICG